MKLCMTWLPLMVLLLIFSTTLVGCHQPFGGGTSRSPKGVLNKLKHQLDCLVVDIHEAERLDMLHSKDVENAKVYILEACTRYDQLVGIYRAEKRIDIEGKEALTHLIALILNISRKKVKSIERSHGYLGRDREDQKSGNIRGQPFQTAQVEGRRGERAREVFRGRQGAFF